MRHDFASRTHRLSYARRTAAERTYASLCDPSIGGIRRGWCRLFGLGKNTLMYALAVVVHNFRIVEPSRQEQPRTLAAPRMGGAAKRRRRYETEEPAQDLDGRPESLHRLDCLNRHRRGTADACNANAPPKPADCGQRRHSHAPRGAAVLQSDG